MLIKKDKKGNKIPPRFNRGILRSFSWFIAIAIICESVNPRGYFLTNWHGDANCIQKEKKELAENNDRVLREILIEYWGKYLLSIEGNTYRVLREILIEYRGKYLLSIERNTYRRELLSRQPCSVLPSKWSNWNICWHFLCNFSGTVPIVKVIFGNALKILGKPSINRAESPFIIKIWKIGIWRFKYNMDISSREICWRC